MVSVLKQFREDPLPGLAGAVAVAGLVSIGACHTLLGILLAVMAVRYRDRFRPPPFWQAILLFAAFTILSAAANGYWREGWPQIRKFYVWATLPLLYSALRSAGQARRVLVGMAAAGTASAAWGLVQFARKYYQAASRGEDFYQSYVGARITGFTSHWQTFAGDLMLAFLITAALLLALAPTLRRRATILALGAGALIALALLLGFTRSIWPATAAGLIVLLWHWRRWAVLSLPIVAGLVVTAAPEPLHSRIVSLWKPNAVLDSNEHRAVLRRTGMAMAADNPWLGVGPERVLSRFLEYYPEDAPRPVPREWYTQHLHNTYIHYAAERGLPAMGALIGFVLLAWRHLWRALAGTPLRGDRRFALLAAAAAVPGILVGGWWEVNLGDSEVLGTFLSVIACGYVAAADAPPDREQPE